MINDPIVEEIHQVREKLLADCQGELDALLDRYKSSEEQDRERVVTPGAVQEKRRRGPGQWLTDRSS